jgi:hypothetical protein
MDEAGTLTGLVGADAAFSGAADDSDSAGADGDIAPAVTAVIKAGVQDRTVGLLQQQLRAKEAAVARMLGGGNKHASKPAAKLAAVRGKAAATRKAHAQHRALTGEKGVVGTKRRTRKLLPAHTHDATHDNGMNAQKRTVSLLKKQLMQRERQLKIIAGAKH